MPGKELVARVFLANGNKPLTLREVMTAVPELKPGTIGPYLYHHTGRYERIATSYGQVRWRLAPQAWAELGGGAEPAPEPEPAEAADG